MTPNIAGLIFSRARHAPDLRDNPRAYYRMTEGDAAVAIEGEALEEIACYSLCFDSHLAF